MVTFFFKKKLFIYFLDRKEGKEKERERNINVWLSFTCPQLGTWLRTQVHALTGNRPGDPLVHRPTLNLLSYTSQGLVTFFLLLSNFKKKGEAFQVGSGSGIIGRKVWDRKAAFF